MTNSSIDHEDDGSPEDLPTVIDHERFEKIVDLVPEDKREEFLSVIEQTISHQGWLPTPEYLAQYEQILPGLAERIVRMPEREQEFRHSISDKMVDRDFKLKRRGQTLAISAMVLLLGFSGALAWIGQPALAASVAIGTIVGVVGIFVSGKWADVKSEHPKPEED